MDIKLFDRALALGNLIGYSGMAYIETNIDFQVISWNPRAKDLFGYSENDVVGQFLYTLIPVTIEKLTQCRQTEVHSVSYINNHGQKIQCEIYCSPITNLKAEKLGMALLAKDISSRVKDSLLLKQQKQWIEELYGFAPIGIYHVQKDNKITMANSEYAWMLGYESSDTVLNFIKDFPAQVFFDQEKAREFTSALSEAGQVSKFRCRLRRKNNSYIWALCFAKATYNELDRMDGFDGFSINISETIRAEEALKKANKKLKILSVMDGLTQIPNRRKFDEYLNSEWKRHCRGKGQFSVIICDIDFFKYYNDTYGHQAGDECLQKVARAIHDCASRSSDLAARYGGEEFAVILPDTDQEGAGLIAERIRTSVKNLKIEHKNSITNKYLTLSLGYSTNSQGHKYSAESLVALADKALYQAKEEGRNQSIGKVLENE